MGSFKIRISDPSREAATWKTGLNGGFGFIATMDLVCPLYFQFQSNITTGLLFGGQVRSWGR